MLGKNIEDELYPKYQSKLHNIINRQSIFVSRNIIDEIFHEIGREIERRMQHARQRRR